MNMGPNFSEATEVDQALYQLATYDVGHGMIILPSDVEEVMNMHRSVARRFNYFKRLIQNSEVTFSDIHKSVVEKNGPFPSKSHNMSIDEILAKLDKDKDKIEGQEKPLECPEDVNRVLSKLFSDILEMTGQNPKLITMGDVENPNPNPNLEETSLYLTPSFSPDFISKEELEISDNPVEENSKQPKQPKQPKKKVLPKSGIKKVPSKEKEKEKEKNGRYTKPTKPKPKTTKNPKSKKDT